MKSLLKKTIGHFNIIVLTAITMVLFSCGSHPKDSPKHHMEIRPILRLPTYFFRGGTPCGTPYKSKSPASVISTETNSPTFK